MATDSFLRSRAQSTRTWTLILALLALAGCTVTKPHRAPVEDRSGPVAEAPVAAPVVEPRSSAVTEAPRPNSYTVRPGDTLIRIALDQGIGWRDLARWNGLDNPNLIEVGQVLRVAAPTAQELAATRAVTSAKVDVKPLDPKATDGRPQASAAPSTASAPASPATAAPAPVMAAASAPDGEPNWAWPAGGSLMAAFDEQRNKGLAIGGKAGDSVLAAADGRVMYAGSGLRGYGNMVIIKHNDTYLSAYAHNQTLLVKEDQVVRRGQAIAEMGSSDTDQVKLHFEIRRKGKPVDPARLLPAR